MPIGTQVAHVLVYPKSEL